MKKAKTIVSDSDMRRLRKKGGVRGESAGRVTGLLALERLVHAGPLPGHAKDGEILSPAVTESPCPNTSS